LELIPTDVLDYPILVPDAPPKPQVTIPVGANGANGGGNAGGHVDCKPFKATSPLDGLNYGTNSFYWDAAPGATSYRINVQGAGSKEIDAPTTTINFDISGAGFNPQLTWSVDALFNGQVACSSQSVTIPRQWAPPPPPTQKPGAPPPFSASWACATTSFTVNYGGLPAGTTSVTINYSVVGGSISPNSGAMASVPPDPGSFFFSSYPPSTFTLTSGSVVANPGGQTVALPPMSC
jgi:hypothetical protein